MRRDPWGALGLAMAVAVTAACSGDEPPAECGGTTPWCSDLVPVPPAPPGGCCGDVGTEASCTGGEWRCPEGFVLGSECRGGWVGDFCANLVDAGGGDGGAMDGGPADASGLEGGAPDAGLLDAATGDGAGGDGGDACDPEAMPTPNAGLAEAAGVGGCPDGMVPVDGFCIDRYEASLAVVNDEGTLTSWSPFFNPEGRRVRALSLTGAVPQGYVSGTQAAAACAEAGKRLCTDVEWLRACQGAAGRTYPYGDARDPGACNDARSTHPAVEYFGTTEAWIWSMLGHPCLNQLPDSVATTGSHAGCLSADGAFDMMGNLHEWTAAAEGTFRGGFYVDTTINGEGCLYATTAHASGYWDYATGFRCCADLP